MIDEHELRQAILEGIDAIARHYPNFAPTNDVQLRALVSDYAEDLAGFDPHAIRAGFALARREAQKFKPTSSEVIACVKRVQKTRSASALPDVADNPDAICARCGTDRLGLFVDAQNPAAAERLYPIHIGDCPVAISQRMVHVSQVRRQEAA